MFEDPLSFMAGTHIRSLGDLKEFFSSVVSGEDDYCLQRRRVLDQVYEESCRTNNCERLLRCVGIGLDRVAN